MENMSDVVVVGGGPCGSFAAYNLAKNGVNVQVFEEHNEIGTPCHCAGHLSIKGLKDLGLYPLPKGIVENVFRGATFHSPKGKGFSIRLSSPVTCTVNRALFDGHIADLAKKAGAHYHLGLRVASLVIKNKQVTGVNVEKNGEQECFQCKIVVDAEGISSRLLRQASLQTLDRPMVVNAVEAEVENVENIETDMVDVFLGTDVAHGFYAWLIPKGEGRAKIGLAARYGNPRDLLHKLMHAHPAASEKLRNARVLQTFFHPVTLGGNIPRTYTDGFLVAGDAASQVKPTTGGGVIFGMNSAHIAAEVACEALQRNDFSSVFLSQYQKRWENAFGLDMWFMLKLRKTLDAMSDEAFDRLIRLCRTVRLDKALKDVGDIDFQGRSLLQIMWSPRVWAALGYFFYIYLSANP